MKKEDHPGAYIPPPLIYAAFFLLSILLQKLWPIDDALLHTTAAHVLGLCFIGLFFCFAFPALWRFASSKNTLITIKAANSLQTTGIYSISRNPMYMGLLFLYFGIAVFAGNWWTYLVSPLLIIVVQFYVIKKEEHYLYRKFGQVYEEYKKRVRRWI